MADDDPMVRSSFRDFLETLGHATHVATNGQEGIELFQDLKEELDLLITDIEMPHIDGLDLIQHVRQQDASLPIIAVSGYLNDDHSKGLANLSIPVFFKPLDFFEFERYLRQF
jgi:CheY-like chemotaxis protein